MIQFGILVRILRVIRGANGKHISLKLLLWFTLVLSSCLTYQILLPCRNGRANVTLIFNVFKVN
jgi:uncharacterized protein with PQ loop repeat